MFAEDLGVQFTSFAQESWKLVLLFILTELKRGFTRCLKEKAGIQLPADVTAPCSSSNHANVSLSVFDLPSTSDVSHDVSNYVSDNLTDDATDDDGNDVTPRVTNGVQCCSSQTQDENTE